MQDNGRREPQPSILDTDGAASDEDGLYDLALEVGPAEGRRRPRGRATMFIVGLIALAGVITLALHRGEVGAFAAQAAKAEPLWLVLATAAQFLAFYSQALVWWIVLRRLNQPKGVQGLFFLSIGKLFADQALPSAGISGAFFIMHALTGRGVPRKDAFTAFVFGAASFIAAFLIAVLASFIYVAIMDGAAAIDAIAFAALSFLALVLTSAGIVIIVFKTPATRDRLFLFKPIAKLARLAGPAARRIRSEKALFARAIIHQLLARSFDGVTLWFAFYAIGEQVSLSTCLVAISIASVAATAAPTPMGLGTFEAGLVAALTAFGAPIESALVTTLLYRGLTLWAPLTAGFFVVQRELLRRRKSASAQPEAPGEPQPATVS